MRNFTLGYLTLDAAPLDTVAAAASAGFTSVGLRITGRRPGDAYPHTVETLDHAKAIKRLAQDHDIRISNVNAFSLFPEVELSHLEQVIALTSAVGADTIVTICNQPDQKKFADTFAHYCELAAQAGIRIVLEFMRFSEIKTIGDASRIVSEWGVSSTGVLIDALHLQRSGGTADDIAAMDPAKIAYFQLCDAPETARRATDDELRTESRTRRLEPGKGTLPLHTFISSLPPGTEIEYEVPQGHQKGLPLSERAQHAYQTLNSYMADYHSHHNN